MGSQCMRFTRVSASIKTTSAFSLGYNACVSHACLHWLKRLFRFLWYCITMHAFQMRVFILRQLRIALQCMRFTRLSASIKTAFAFSMLWGHNACVSHACLHLLRQLLRCFWYRVTMHAFHRCVCIGLDDF